MEMNKVLRGKMNECSEMKDDITNNQIESQK